MQMHGLGGVDYTIYLLALKFLIKEMDMNLQWLMAEMNKCEWNIRHPAPVTSVIMAPQRVTFETF